jgi:4-amino-4-deoxy-L-arabinose transferase-like glycosyltransferase
MSLPFAVMLGLVIYRWSRELYGDFGGVVSLVAFCFCPNFLAHAPLVTPDVMLSCFTVTTAWRLHRLAKHANARNVLLAGAAVGLMLLSKYTALLLVPILIATDVCYRVSVGRIHGRSLSGVWGEMRHWLFILGIGFLLLWAAYGFQVGPLTTPSGTRLTVPAAHYVHGAMDQYLESRVPHSCYLMGMHSSTGWWYYYVVVCLIKIPTAVLILLLGVAIARGSFGITRHVDELYLVVPFVLVFIYLSAFNTIQIGFRYLLPVYPLLLIALGNYGGALRASARARIVVGFLMIWVVASALAAWPDYIPLPDDNYTSPWTTTTLPHF